MNVGITDPSDWPVEFAPLREIDSNLRCPICKELLRAAIMLQCFHNFCSECIRRHLDKESTCPACRVQTSTSHMRRNVALDEIASSFGDCRSLLLKTVINSLAPKVAKTEPQLSRAESMDIDDVAPQSKRRRTSSRLTNKSSSNPSSQDTVDTNGHIHMLDDDDKDDDFMISSQGSTSTHKGKNVTRSTAGPTLRSRSGRSEQSPADTIEKPDSAQSSSASQLAALQPPTSSSTNAIPEPTKPKPSTLVACPVCQNGIPESYTNTHLDKYCFRDQKDPAYTIPYDVIIRQDPKVIEVYERQGTTTRNVVGPTTPNAPTPPSNGNSSIFSNGGATSRSSDGSSPLQNRTKNLSISGSPVKQPYPELKRIPKLTYSLLNEKQLRKKLSELGLASHGDKQLMQKRHAEYVTIYNANCDSTRPQTIAQLKKTMEIWEDTYMRDLDAKQVQRRQLEQQHARQALLAKQESQAIAPSGADSGASPLLESTATPPSSQGTSSTAGEGSGGANAGFVPNQANNTNVAVAVAEASAFAHVLKYADEYAELMADVRKRQQADKEKRALANATKAE